MRDRSMERVQSERSMMALPLPYFSHRRSVSAELINCALCSAISCPVKCASNSSLAVMSPPPLPLMSKISPLRHSGRVCVLLVQLKMRRMVGYQPFKFHFQMLPGARIVAIQSYLMAIRRTCSPQRTDRKGVKTSGPLCLVVAARLVFRIERNGLFNGDVVPI